MCLQWHALTRHARLLASCIPKTGAVLGSLHSPSEPAGVLVWVPSLAAFAVLFRWRRPALLDCGCIRGLSGTPPPPHHSSNESPSTNPSAPKGRGKQTAAATTKARKAFVATRVACEGGGSALPEWKSGPLAHRANALLRSCEVTFEGWRSVLVYVQAVVQVPTARLTIGGWS